MNFNWHLTGNKKPHSSGFLGFSWIVLDVAGIAELVEAASTELVT